jgi:hypothetical protein
MDRGAPGEKTWTGLTGFTGLKIKGKLQLLNRACPQTKPLLASGFWPALAAGSTAKSSRVLCLLRSLRIQPYLKWNTSHCPCTVTLTVMKLDDIIGSLSKGAAKMATSNPIVTLSRNRMFLLVICMVLAAGLAVLIFAPVVSGMTIKEFRNGQWVECDTSNPDGCDVDTATKEIHLEKSRGVYELPVRVNGVLTLNFVLDTGAAEVNIPANVAAQLLRSGSISQEDFLPGRIY